MNVRRTDCYQFAAHRRQRGDIGEDKAQPGYGKGLHLLDYRGAKFHSRGVKPAADEGWDRQTRKKPAVPCRVIEMVARKCGFAGQPERRLDRSDPGARGNAISVLT